MNVVMSAITCVDCRKILDNPILLPCGQSVCLQHVENLAMKSYDCKSCGLEHKSDDIKLYVNRAVENLIKAHLEKIDLGADYNEACQSCDQLDELVKQFEELRKDPTLFINDTVSKLKSQADILREELKLMIDAKANKLIDELDEYERECKSKLDTNELRNTLDKMEKDVTAVKKDLHECRNLLSYFDSKIEDLKTIKKKSKESILKMKRKKLYLKQEILLQNFLHYHESVKSFPKNVCTVHSEEFSFELIDDLKELCEAYVWPFAQSKIVNSTSLQKKLIDLCELSHCSEWALLYRANEHGFGAKDFHLRCDNIPKTLTIIQSSNGHVFGGYTDVPWDCSNDYKQSTNTFIFSLINANNHPIKVNIDPNETQFAIGCDESEGPIFGEGHDIYIANNCHVQMQNYSNFPYSYKCPNVMAQPSEDKSLLAGSYYFNVSNIEVYKLIKDESN